MLATVRLAVSSCLHCLAVIVQSLKNSLGFLDHTVQTRKPS